MGRCCSSWDGLGTAGGRRQELFSLGHCSARACEMRGGLAFRGKWAPLAARSVLCQLRDEGEVQRGQHGELTAAAGVASGTGHERGSRRESIRLESGPFVVPAFLLLAALKHVAQVSTASSVGATDCGRRRGEDAAGASGGAESATRRSRSGYYNVRVHLCLLGALELLECARTTTEQLIRPYARTKLRCLVRGGEVTTVAML